MQFRDEAAVEIVLDSGAFTGFGRDSKTETIKENDNKKRNSDAVSFNIFFLLQLALKKQTARMHFHCCLRFENHENRFRRRNYENTSLLLANIEGGSLIILLV